MCGIIGYLGPNDAVKILLTGLKRLEYRGYDSAGLAVLEGDKLILRKVKGKIKALEEHLTREPLHGSYGLGHTRWATHGRPNEENAHPHLDCTGTLAVVHNGIIENYAALRESLKKEGHGFHTETDTEVIVHLVEKYFAGSLEEAMVRAVRELEGSFAAACISARDPGKIVVAKNGPPVVVGIGNGEFFLASDINPLLEHTRSVVFLGDKEIGVMSRDGVRYLAFSGQPIRKKAENVTWTPSMIEKRGFKHFMAKEIFDQPEVIRDTLEGRVSLGSGRVFFNGAGLAPAMLKDVGRAVLVACGTSYHAALVGKYFLESHARIPVEVEYASELRARDFVIDKRTLVVGISQSGETADTLAAVRALRGGGTALLAITNNINSSLARESDGVLDTHAGPEIGVAATKTFSAQMGALFLLSLYWGQSTGILDPGACLPLIQEFQRIPHRMESVLRGARTFEDLAKRCLLCSDYLYLGRWVNFPVALEGALKLKEISYTHAEGYAGGEMKHGPIALIDEKMTTLAIVPRDRVYEKMLGNIAEVRARGGRILAVAFENDADVVPLVDEVLPIPEVPQLLTPFLTILPLQLFAYYSAAAKGLDVDQPRNLAKSVTVE
jgi:glucosamine--fructose-6-phosphate aminotransferase (isomerizing)